jgi:pimeloyl-ACP methyl ester carboxylesterase
MTGWQEGEVEVAGLRLHYLRTGGDKPPIVLSHGVSDSGSCWSSLIRVLAPQWDVVAWDARGHGDSEAAPSGYTGEVQAGDLLGLVDALGLESPVLMGHSMGGETSAWAAVQRPTLPRAVVMEDSGPPSLRITDPEARETTRKMLTRWIRDLLSRSPEDLTEQARRDNSRWPEEDLRPWAESKRRVSAEAIDGFALEERGDLWARASEIQCPVLLLRSEKPADEQAQQRAMVERLPQGEIVFVEGAGHNVRRDEPGQAAYHLGRFLAGLA